MAALDEYLMRQTIVKGNFTFNFIKILKIKALKIERKKNLGIKLNKFCICVKTTASHLKNLKSSTTTSERYRDE